MRWRNPAPLSFIFTLHSDIEVTSLYFCDIHTHSLLSPDSNAPLADMAQRAVALGLDELCVTDHCDLVDGSGRPVNSFDWPAAKEQFRRVQAQVGGRLNLRLGLELGSAVYDPDLARRILEAQGGTICVKRGRRGVSDFIVTLPYNSVMEPVSVL